MYKDIELLLKTYKYLVEYKEMSVMAGNMEILQ